MQKQLDSFADAGNQQSGEHAAISRRKLLAAIGMTGAGMAAGALMRDGIGFASRRGSIAETVYGSSAQCDECVILATIAELRSMASTVPGSIFYVTDTGQEGHFYYDPGDSVSPDNTGLVLVSTGGYRFKRIYDGPVNVKWFGAKGDGSADDTAAIQAAISSLTSGGVAFLPSSSYIVSSTIIIPYSYVKIMGCGSSTVIKAANTSNYETMISANGLNGIEVSDLVVDANQGNRTGLTNRTVGILLASCTDSSVDNCTVQNTIGANGIPGVGIALGGVSVRCKVTGCILKDCGVAGKASDGVYTSGTQNLIMNCIALNCTDTGFVIEKSNLSGIIGCTAKKCGAGAAITNASANDVTGNFIDGLTIYDWSASNTGGIQIGTPLAVPGALLNTRVSNVTMERVAGSGPSVYARQQGGKIIGLTLENIRINGAGTQGILFTATDILIANCHVYNTTNAGIQSLGVCERVIVEGCYIYGGSFGIALSTGCSDCHLVGNVIIGITDQTNYGIYCFGTETNINCIMNTIEYVKIRKIGYDAGTTPKIFSTANASISTNAAASATTLGTLSQKIQIFDKDGSSIGFIPIYSTIS
ncbi:right-handed parallel beta-helix repeat-containing protein [Paenibacillus mesophilus]|uniref:right-handed parallel beta-helix repeat-containing protein n=1 Tax=Paenibacillus mesophilus TaxID=2582849 RepID=UPI0013053AF0|nr:right-handed parallel beta-helix repeat-containing protein [Paenibacillus mesophilus]